MPTSGQIHEDHPSHLLSPGSESLFDLDAPLSYKKQL
jgi:hypothetical protein